ncbi:MAG: hypothetical protein QOG64_2550, partial [Acidimicrobiaceae bacterium]|nr:hypothetical protein [Acidimicrobiaceae bacterium]
EGDIVGGSALAAFKSRPFVLVWGGTFLSNIGTWMQNIGLGVLGYKLTHSAAFVGLLGFAQLGPLLILALPGGALADSLDRRKLLIWMQTEQLIFSIALAFVVVAPRPNKTLLLAMVLAVGLGNALSGPALAALLPTLVPRRDLPGAVSLQSVQMNLSRVIGPALGGLLLPWLHFDGLFAINAATYLFAVAGLVAARIDRRPAGERPERGQRRGWSTLVGGFAVARHDPLVRVSLRTITIISFFSLPFIGLMPVIAEQNLNIDSKSIEYGFLYAAFGLGAAVGAVLVGTVLVRVPRPPMVRLFLASFAVMLAVFALLRISTLAYPVAFLVGLGYFGAVTALSTTLQEHLDDQVRGRVMALWIMGFGGTVPLGLLAGGAVANRTSVTDVVLAGAAITAILALTTRVRVPVREPAAAR